MIPSPALLATAGDAPVVLIAPHATAPVDAARPFVDEAHHEALAAHVNEWHDAGSGEALAAAAAALGAPSLRSPLPRGLVDLNRGWRGRVEAKETLFGKGALDAWSAAHLRPGVRDALEGWYRAAMGEIAAAAVGARGLVELHSYGDLGSTYDRLAGGRPVRRAEAAVVTATPWTTAYPVGLARLIPGDLRGTPWALEREVGDALAAAGLRPGPHPYPAQGPWALSTRFLAARWFAWLARTGRLPSETADRLVRLAWHDEQDAEVDAVATGERPEPPHLAGVARLAAVVGEWSHDGPALGDAFLADDGSFTLVVELRNDRLDRAEAFGEAVAAGIRRYLG